MATFKTLCIPMPIEALKDDKSLKNTLRFSLRERNFSKFPGEHAPRLP